MKRAYLATIHVLIPAEDQGEACDAIAETMRPLSLLYGNGSFIDWQHATEAGPVAVELPDGFVADDEADFGQFRRLVDA